MKSKSCKVSKAQQCGSMLLARSEGCCDTSIQIEDSFGDETIIYDFQTDENQNERYVLTMLLGHDLIYL